MKFSIPKEMLQIFRNLYSDEAFHERHLKRIDNELNAAHMIEAKRVNCFGKEIKHIDLNKGEIEYGDIIKPKEAEKVEIAKK